MSINYYYQAIPCEAELRQLAHSNPEEVADVLFPILFGESPVREARRYSEKRYQPLFDLFKNYPDLDQLHFDARAKYPSVYFLMSAVDSDARRDLPRAEQEKTLGYQIFLGYAPFNEQFSKRTGARVRVSPPHFVKDVALYCQVIDRQVIPEGLQDDFDGFVNFYQIIALHSDLSVFTMEI